MSKAFTKESDQDDDEDIEPGASPLPPGSKNYITPGGHLRLKQEFDYLLKKDRPTVTAAVSWAAKNGDRSENADYQYGKKRLREIDRRLRFLTKRLDALEARYRAQFTTMDALVGRLTATSNYLTAQFFSSSNSN